MNIVPALRRRPRWPRPEFLPKSRRARWLTWLILAGAGLVFACAVADAFDVQAQLAAQREDAARWQRRASRPVAARATVAVDERGAMAAQGVARALAHPWPAVLSAVERSTPAGVQWLAWTHVAGEAPVRLEGVATDGTQAFAVLEALAAEPGFSAVVLTRLANGEGVDASSLRFEIVAQVDAAALRGGETK